MEKNPHDRENKKLHLYGTSMTCINCMNGWFVGKCKGWKS